MDEKTKERPDFFSMYAREKLGLPNEWRWFRLQAMDGVGTRYHLITGGIPTALYKSGPRKGAPNWKKSIGQREVIVSNTDLLQFERDWEAKTGLCSKCGGSGQELARYSVADGSSFRPCSRCARASPPSPKETERE